MQDLKDKRMKGRIYINKTTLVRLAIVLGVLLLVFLTWFILSPPESRGVVYVKNVDGGVRAVPLDPGGFRADDKGYAVYKLVDKGSPGQKEEVVRVAEKESRHYYTIHTDVVNICSDRDAVKNSEGAGSQKEGPSLDLGTFTERAQALRMLHDIARKEPYKTLLKDYMDQAVICERDGRCRYYVLSIVDLEPEDAGRLCRALKEAGKDALVRK